MASKNNHVINFDNIVNFVNPAELYMTDNGVATIPSPEDYTIFVDLEMEVPRRSNSLVTSDAAGRFILKWEIGDTSERSLNSGSDFYRNSTKNSTIQYLSTDGTEYIYTDVKNGKKTGEMFGMENIHVDYNAYFVPEITIKFTDVRGTSLLSPAQQRAESQGYAVKANSHLDADSLNRIANDIEGSFFQGLFAFPYPKMTLKIKGLYGDPIAYELTVSKVDSELDSASGNYSVTVKMIGYAFSLLNDITMAALIAAPSDLLVGKDHWDNVIQKDERYLLSGGERMPRLSELMTKLAQLAKEQELLDKKEETLKETNRSQIERTQAVINELDNLAKSLSDNTIDGKTVGYTYKEGLTFIIPSKDIASSKEDAFTKILQNDSNKAALNRLNKVVEQYYVKGTDVEGLPRGGFVDSETISNGSGSSVFVFYSNAVERRESGNYYKDSAFQQKITLSGDNNLVIPTEAGVYSVLVFDPGALKERLKVVLTKLNDNETTITNEIQSEQISHYQDVLGFVPSLQNVMAIIMAHFECLLAGFKHVEDTVKQKVGEGNRNPEAMSITGSYYDVTANKQMFPFPQVTTIQTTGDLTRKSTSTWLGHFPGAQQEPEVQWIEGLIRGIMDFKDNDEEAVNISKSDSSATAGLVTSCFAAYTDLLITSYRNDQSKSPWGTNINFSLSEDLAARIAVRAQQVMMAQNETGFGDNINPGYLAILDAYNFYKLYERDFTQTATKTLTDKDLIKKLVCDEKKVLWGGVNEQTFLSPNRGNRYSKCTIGNNDGQYSSTNMAAIPLYGYDVSGFYNEKPGVWAKSQTSGHDYDCQNFKILNEQGWLYSESPNYQYNSVEEVGNRIKVFKTSDLKGYLSNSDEVMKSCGFSTTSSKYVSWKKKYQEVGENNLDIDDVVANISNYSDDNIWKILGLPGNIGINPFFVFDYYSENDVNARAFVVMNSFGIYPGSVLKSKFGFTSTTIAQIVFTGAWLWAEKNHAKFNSLARYVYDRDEKYTKSNCNNAERMFYINCFLTWVNENFLNIEKTLALCDKNTGAIVSSKKLYDIVNDSGKKSVDYNDLSVLVDMARLEKAYGKFTVFKEEEKRDSYTLGERITPAQTIYPTWARKQLTPQQGKVKYKFDYFDNTLVVPGFFNDIDLEITTDISKELQLYSFVTEQYTVLDLTGVNVSAMRSMKESYFNMYLDNFTKAIKNLTKDQDYDEPIQYDKQGNQTILSSKVDESFKIDLYNYLKKVYDKWLAGNNYVLTQKSKQAKLNKSWYDDYCYDNFYKKHFYFIDDLYNEVGDYILINFTTLLRELHQVLDTNVSLLQFITNLEAKHGVQFLSIQNFSNLGDKDCLERAFQQVPIYDMRNVSPTPDFISIYSYKPSQALNIPGSDYDDDSVSMQTELMVKETVKPNKISVNQAVHQLPCFGVPYASQYQHFFTDIALNTSESMATMDSINATFSLANLWQGGNSDRKVYSMGQDLYTVYNNRSYTCTLTMLGSAWVQPLMYFELLNIPMFKGAYQIKKVTHDITQGRMVTKITGVRICRYIDNFIINANALSLTDSYVTKKKIGDGKKANVGNDCNYTRYDVVTKTRNDDVNRSRNITILSAYNPDWLNIGNETGVNYSNAWEMILGTIKSIVTDNTNKYVTPGKPLNIQLVASLFYVQAYYVGWEAFFNRPEISVHKGRKTIGAVDPDDNLIKSVVEEVFMKSPATIFGTKVTLSHGSYMEIALDGDCESVTPKFFKTVYMSNNATNDTQSGNAGYASTLENENLKPFRQSDCFVFYGMNEDDVRDEAAFGDSAADSSLDLNVAPAGDETEPNNLTDREVLFIRALKKTLGNVDAFAGGIKVKKMVDGYIYIYSSQGNNTLTGIIFDAIVSTYLNETTHAFLCNLNGVFLSQMDNSVSTKTTLHAVQLKLTDGANLNHSVGYRILAEVNTDGYFTMPFNGKVVFPDDFKKTIVKNYFGKEVTMETIEKARNRASELPNYTPAGNGSTWSDTDIDLLVEHFKGIKIEDCLPLDDTAGANCQFRKPSEYLQEAKERFEAEGKDSSIFTKEIGGKKLENLFASSTASNKKLSNEPTKDEYYVNAFNTLKNLANLLKMVGLDIKNVTITSCFRSACVNNAVSGSSKSSMHMKGYAIDLQYNAGKTTTKDNIDYVYNAIVEYAKIYYQTYKQQLFDQLLCESRSNGSYWLHFGDYSLDASGSPRRRGQYFLMVNDKRSGNLNVIG